MENGNNLNEKPGPVDYKPEYPTAPPGSRLRHLSILPSVFTSLNLFCGYLSIIFTAREEFLAAGWMVVLAVVCDILDGRIARFTSLNSKFGAELDSLADLVSFGVAPAFLVFSRYMSDNLLIGITASSIYVLCGALRLARFNITPPSGKDVFEGLPIPAGAGILTTLTILELQFLVFFIPDTFIPIVVTGTAFLMVSKIEYPAMKKSKKTGFQRQVLVGLFILALAVFPPITLFLYSWGFAIYGLFMFILKKFLNLIKYKKPVSEKPA